MLLGLAFKALNDATRREILEMLREKDLTAGEIVKQFNISGASISHHLELLKRAGLIDSQKKGQFITYRLNTTVLDEILKWIIQLNTSKPQQ